MQGSRNAVADMLRGDGTYGTVLLLWAVDHFGIDPETRQPYVFSWAPETVRREVKEDTGVELSARNLGRLMTAIAVVTTDMFFKDVSKFVTMANVLSGDVFDPEEFDPADSVECAWAITEALILWPPDEDEPFSDDIRHYIAHVLKEEGYVTPPDVLRIAVGADLSADVGANFADDPEMMQAIYQNQQAKNEEVAEAVAGGLYEMLTQLRTLGPHLKTGKVDDVEKQILAALQKVTRSEGESR